ncbi:hypothetical protein ACCO45_009872 [Purpureocillium lilacinum]|uniref:Uncharacterized protein n=1 Tax=Purpureocillium lilacinum TaxID=33203 RepID=A0ACC4DKJ7_PURLI
MRPLQPIRAAVALPDAGRHHARIEGEGEGSRRQPGAGRDAIGPGKTGGAERRDGGRGARVARRRMVSGGGSAVGAGWDSKNSQSQGRHYQRFAAEQQRSRAAWEGRASQREAGERQGTGAEIVLSEIVPQGTVGPVTMRRTLRPRGTANRDRIVGGLHADLSLMYPKP